MQAVLLAAGASSRMWPVVEGKHKSLLVLLGKPLIRWTIESLYQAGVDEVVVVQGPERQVEAVLQQGPPLSLKVRFVQQADAHGMGDALLCAEALLQDRFLLLHPYRFDAATLVLPVLQKVQATGAPFVLSAQPTDQPQHYGILTVTGDRATGLVEKPSKEQAPSNLRVMGIYYLSKTILDAYRSVPNSHYAFEDALQRCMETSEVRVTHITQRVTPLKHPWDVLALSGELLKTQIKEPYIDPSARIDPSAIIKGPVHVGPNVRVFENAVIKGPCYLGAGVVVGTHSLVRECTVLEEGVVIGAHCEVARSVFGAGATTHSGFFGDSFFAPKAKAGAGTITANVRVDRKEIFASVKGKRIATGLHSLGAIVGAHTHIGIQSMLMPGVLLGSNCLVGPGALVQGSVPSESRYFERTL